MATQINSEPVAPYGPADTHPRPTAFSAQDQTILDQATAILECAVNDGDALTSPDLTRRYLTLKLRGFEQEVFSALFLDNRHRVVGFKKLFYGTIDGATVHPREVVKAALASNAAAVILAHNHPSGVAEPSRADQQLTKRLTDALGFVDVRVLDHIVVGDGPAVSMAERGLV